MALIFIASADPESGPRGSRILVPILRWLVPEISPAGLERTVGLARKGVHVVAFGILAGLLAWALQRSAGGRPNARPLVTAWLVTLAYAVSDEVHQCFVPSRVGSPGDVAIDMLGATVMLVGIWRVGQRKCRP